MANPIETKVIAATTGSGVGAAIGVFIIWLLGVLVWHGSSTSAEVANTMAAVPTPVADLILIAISVGSAFLGGYVAPHTHRRGDSAK